MPDKNRFVILAYGLVYLIWSTTYLAVKLGVHDIPVYLFVGMRWFFSGLFLLLCTFVLYRKKAFSGVTKKQIFNSLVAGLFIVFLNNVFFSESMRSLDSYLAAVITATSPLVLTLFDYFVNRINFSWQQISAIALGIIGIAVLLYKGSADFSLDFHVITLLAGLAFFGFGSALSHRLDLPKNSIFNASVQMLFSGIIGFTLFFITGTPSILDLSNLNLISVAALAYLIVFGAIGMMSYIYLIKHEPLSRVSTYAFVNPIGATILGILIGEKLKSSFFIAAPMIFVALLILLRSRVNMPHMEAEGER